MREGLTGKLGADVKEFLTAMKEGLTGKLGADVKEFLTAMREEVGLEVWS